MSVIKMNTTSADGVAHVALAGRFDFNSHRPFRDLCERLLGDASIGQIEIDLAEVTYLDSSALGMLLLLREKANAADKALALGNCRDMVRQVLDVANFGKLFTIR